MPQCSWDLSGLREWSTLRCATAQPRIPPPPTNEQLHSRLQLLADDSNRLCGCRSKCLRGGNVPKMKLNSGGLLSIQAFLARAMSQLGEIAVHSQYCWTKILSVVFLGSSLDKACPKIAGFLYSSQCQMKYAMQRLKEYPRPLSDEYPLEPRLHWARECSGSVVDDLTAKFKNCWTRMAA